MFKIVQKLKFAEFKIYKMAKKSTNVKMNNETRSNIIKLLESGTHTKKTVSEIFDIPYSIVARIFQLYLTQNKNS